MNINENLHVEFKSDMPKRDNLQKYIASFSNSEGGTMWLGVNDDGNIFDNSGFHNMIHSQIWDKLRSKTPARFHHYIQQIWKVSKKPFGPNKKEIWNIKAAISAKAIPTKVKENGENYYNRINASTEKIELNDLNTRFTEIRKSNIKKTLFLKLTGESSEFHNEHILKSYNLIVEDYNTQLGNIFSDNGTLVFEIPTKDKKYNVWSLNELISDIEYFYNTTLQIGATVKPIVKYIGHTILSTVIREHVLNSLAHSNLDDPIKINWFNNSIETINKTNTNQFIELLKEGKIHHTTTNPHRFRLLTKLHWVEGESRGYNELLKRHTLQNDFLIFIKQEGRTINIIIFFLKTIDVRSQKFFQDIKINQKSSVIISDNIKKQLQKYFHFYPLQSVVKEGVHIW